ncbi:MAG: hypothetical protein ACRDRC_08900, partial [Pseudonocardiaceae bacterium]
MSRNPGRPGHGGVVSGPSVPVARDAPDGPHDAAQPQGKPAAVEIEFVGVTKRYAGQDAPAINNLSLTVPA